MSECELCRRPKPLEDGRCAACRAGTARATGFKFAPKAASADWWKDWKPLNQAAKEQADLRAQRVLGMAVEELAE